MSPSPALYVIGDADVVYGNVWHVEKDGTLSHPSALTVDGRDQEYNLLLGATTLPSIPGIYEVAFEAMWFDAADRAFAGGGAFGLDLTVASMSAASDGASSSPARSSTVAPAVSGMTVPATVHVEAPG